MCIYIYIYIYIYTSYNKNKTIFGHTILGLTRAQGVTGGESFLEPKEAFLMISACLSLAVF